MVRRGYLWIFGIQICKQLEKKYQKDEEIRR